MDTALVVVSQLPADEHPLAVYLASVAPGTRLAVKDSLGIVARILSGGKADMWGIEWAHLRFQHVAAVRSKLADAYAPATGNKIMAYLRSVLKTAWRLGQLSAEDYQRAIDVRPITGERLMAGRAISEDELVELFRVCRADPRKVGRRDTAVLALLRVTGLRRAELCSLSLADYNPAEGSLTVIGKRNKERKVYLSQGATQALLEWLAVRGEKPGPLFCPITKMGKLRLQYLTPQVPYQIIQARSKEAGLEMKTTPHDFRRSLAGDLLDEGVDLVTVQHVLGHANANTTARYDRRGERAKIEAILKIEIPL